MTWLGDFEPHRNENDLNSMTAPSKYRKLGDFHQYYEGKRIFSWPVHSIGGNHEQYAFLDKSIDGFEITPNYSYIGRSQKINVVIR